MVANKMSISPSTAPPSSPIRTRSRSVGSKSRQIPVIGKTAKKPNPKQAKKELETLKKLTVKEMLKKHIDKELKIVLRKCDDPGELRPSSSNTNEPLPLEASNILFPSPASSIASRPPLLTKEVPVRLISSSPIPVDELAVASLRGRKRRKNGNRGPRTSTPLRDLSSPDSGVIPEEVQLEKINQNPLETGSDRKGETILKEIEVAVEPEINQSVVAADNVNREEIVNHVSGHRVVSESERLLLLTQEMQVSDGDDEDEVMVNQQQSPVPPVDNLQGLDAASKPTTENYVSGPPPVQNSQSQNLRVNSQRSRSPMPSPIPFSELPVGAFIVASDDDSEEDEEEENEEVGNPISEVGNPRDKSASDIASLTALRNEDCVNNLPSEAIPSSIRPPRVLMRQRNPGSKSSRITNGCLQNPVSPEAGSSAVSIPVKDSGGPLESGIHNEVSEEDEEELQPVLNFKALARSAARVLDRSPCPPTLQDMWFSCVMWDSKVLNEMQSHEKMGFKLMTTYAMGKLLAECIHLEGHSWPGVAKMDWTEPYVMLDIITDTFGTCGSHRSLRVQEKRTADTALVNVARKTWDLVVLPECQNLADEMVRQFSFDVKTTVVLYGVEIDNYPQPWDGVDGEILLKPTNRKDSTLAVLIYHHENLTEQRSRYIHGHFPESELWEGFQNPELDNRTFMQVETEVDDSPTHFTLHVKKAYKSKVALPPPRPLSPFALFPDGDPFDEDIVEEVIMQESISTNGDQSVERMEEEEWSEFLSVSRVASRTPSVVSDNPVGNRVVRDLTKRPFKRPSVEAERRQQKKVMSTSHGRPIQANGFSGNGALNGKGLPTIMEASRNGDVGDELNQSSQLNGNAADGNNQSSNGDSRSDQGEGITFDKNGFRVLSESQILLLLTQELDSSDDDDLVINRQQQQKKKQLRSNDWEETGQTGNTSSSVLKSPAKASKQPASIYWGKGSTNNNTTAQNHAGVSSSHVRDNRKLNGIGGGGGEGSRTDKEKNPTETGKKSSPRQTQQAPSSSSQQYHFSEVLNHL